MESHGTVTLRLVVSNQTDPFLNVAVENYLLSLPETSVVTLYLWKNHRTVVIGQNQNPYAECNVDLLESEGGHLMRRRTGGGAVYHDDGNLNFSFVVPHALYDQERQFSVLQRAVEAYGLHTEVSGRNDVLCEGRKFSGNAFNKSRYQHLHHGTILIKGNMADLQRYLKVKPSKLQKHGVASVRSRVVNLSELADVTSINIVPHLIAAFEQVYGGVAQRVEFAQLAALPEVRELAAEFESDAWRFGKWRTFQAQRSAQFDWGHVEVSVTVDADVITDLLIATDSLDLALIDEARRLLVGQRVSQPFPATDNPQLQDLLNLLS